MPIKRIQFPDGSIKRVEVPEGATNDEILAFVQSQAAAKPDFGNVRGGSRTTEGNDPTEGMAPWQLNAAGVGRSLMTTLHGFEQLGADVAPLIAPPFLRPFLRQKAQESREDEARRRIGDQPLLDTSAGRTGDVVGTVAQFVGPGGLAKLGARVPGMAPRAVAALETAGNALLPRTVAGSAAQGAAVGATQPLAMGENRLAKTAQGTAFGAAGAALPRVIGSAARTGWNMLVAPFTESGQNRIVAETLQRSAANPAALHQPAPSAIPGVVRTLAEETADPGIAQLQRQFPVQLASQAARNNAARAEEVRRVFNADPNFVDLKELQASQLAQQTKRTMRSGAAPDVKPVTNLLDKLIAARAGRPGVQQPLEFVKNLVARGPKTAAEAWNIRQTIDDLMNGKLGNDAPSSRAARAELMLAKNMLDRQMRGVFPEWGDFLRQYKGLMGEVDQAKVGQEVLERGRAAVDPTTGERAMTAAALSRAVNDPDALVRSATGFGKARADRTLTPAQLRLLSNLGEDAARMDAAQNAGRATGSNTAQNLATQNVLRKLAGSNRLANVALDSQLARRLSTPLEKTYGLFGVPERLQQVLADALSDPQRARALLGRLPPADRRLVEQEIGRIGALTGTTVTATTE